MSHYQHSVTLRIHIFVFYDMTGRECGGFHGFDIAVPTDMIYIIHLSFCYI